MQFSFSFLENCIVCWWLNNLLVRSFCRHPFWHSFKRYNLETRVVCLGAMLTNNKHIKLNILIVEDNLINQMVLESYVTKMGHTYELAENGKEALEMFGNGHHFDCILMDIQMPVMDGMEATKRIRKMENGNEVKIPIVAVTASSPFEDRMELKRSGMNDYIPKPVNLKILKHVLRKVHRNEYNLH